MVFWPSLLMDGLLWKSQAAYFSGSHTVVLVDPPGHGHSEPLTRLFDFRECAGARLCVLDGTAHLAALESPDRVNALIEDFIREQP
jgi:3-oxoadipate enol-lactonase